jgi:uncharacterized protein YoaH (UPF0181 family)
LCAAGTLFNDSIEQQQAMEAMQDIVAFGLSGNFAQGEGWDLLRALTQAALRSFTS